MVGGVDREVVVPHGAQQEGGGDGDGAGVVRLVAQGVGVAGRDDACVDGVGGGQASADVGPVVAGGVRSVEHGRSVSALVGGGLLGGVGRVEGAGASDDAVVGVVGDVGGAVEAAAVDDGGAQASLGSRDGDGGVAWFLQRPTGVCALWGAHPAQCASGYQKGCEDAHDESTRPWLGSRDRLRVGAGLVLHVPSLLFNSYSLTVA